MKPAVVEQFFAALAAHRPDPRIELDSVNPYTLLVAVVLSAQTTDVGVNKATAPLFKKIKTPQAMVDWGEDNLREAVKTLNLYKTKAKNIIALSRRLVDDFGGEVPDDRSALESLPGVGRKSANVVLNSAFGQPTIGVDTHAFRVSNRTGLAPGKTPLEVEEKLLKVVPEKYLSKAHHWLVLHGRYVCKAKKPMCSSCVVCPFCAYKDKALD